MDGALNWGSGGSYKVLSHYCPSLVVLEFQCKFSASPSEFLISMLVQKVKNVGSTI